MTARRLKVLLCIGGALLLGAASAAGCSTTSLSQLDASSPQTVGGVGLLPGEFGPQDPQAGGTVVLPNELPGPIASPLLGNRLIIIGDSIMASISQRYGGQACNTLVPLGWQVEVDAETGRFVEFGAKVLDKRLAAGWDAAVVLLGNNYLYDETKYRAELHDLLDRLSPRPTVLLTTTVFRPQQQEVNRAIVAEASLFANVLVVDWAAITQERSLTGADRLHLTEAGRARLAATLAEVLGAASGNEGRCLATEFRDDSAAGPAGTKPPSGTVVDPSSSAPSSIKPATTTKPPSTTVKSSTTTTTTTVKPPSTTTTTVKPPTTTTTTAPTTPTS